MKLKTFILLILLTSFGCKSYGQISIETLNSRILGVWFLERNSKVKFEFLSNGEIRKYVNETLESVNNYSITEICNNEKLPGEKFLKITIAEKETFCFLLKEIDENNSGILSYINSREAKETRLVKQKNKASR